MFEKEAEEYADKDFGMYEPTDHERYAKETDWRNGAEFGYNFAKEEIDYLNKHWGNGKDTDLAIDKPVYAIHLSNIREV